MDSKIEAMKMKFLNTKTKDKIRNTNRRSELGMDKIKNYIQDIKMVWRFEVDGRKGDTWGNAAYRNEEETIQKLLLFLLLLKHGLLH